MDADPEKWLVTPELLANEIAKVKKARTQHAGETGKVRRRIGFDV
jgi:hypothetical protein